MSLDNTLNQYFTSKVWNKKINDEGVGYGRDARDIKRDIKSIVHKEIITLVSKTTGDRFLDNYNIESTYNSAKTMSSFDITVKFNDNVYRDSISPNYNSVYLPALINNMWSSNPKDKVFGKDRHGQKIVSSDKYMTGDYKEFMQKICKEIQNKYPNVKITLDSKYY